ncbi:MAG: hypothetical protein R3266_08100, partial [Gemmatimonadota bacterium]|nr:hypothetical protein [Gemmatimonadota bacterium]
MTSEPSKDRSPVPRWVGVVALLSAAFFSEPSLERWAVPDGEIGSTALRAALLAFDVGAVVFGAWVVVRRPRSRIPWNGLGLAAAGAVATWFLAFTAVDTLAPELLGGTGVPYFEIRARFQPDSTLVMVPRRTRRERAFELRGDLHVPDDDLPDPAVSYRATYNALGFRANGGAPPFRILVIGDSFVEFGERDSATVSEMLRRETGLSTFNLGRGWYGPHHYVALLERHGLP